MGGTASQGGIRFTSNFLFLAGAVGSWESRVPMVSRMMLRRCAVSLFSSLTTPTAKRIRYTYIRLHMQTPLSIAILFGVVTQKRFGHRSRQEKWLQRLVVNKRNFCSRADSYQATVRAALVSPDEPREDFIEAFPALHQDNLNLSLIFSDAVGDPIFRFAKVEVIRAQVLEGRME